MEDNDSELRRGVWAMAFAWRSFREAHCGFANLRSESAINDRLLYSIILTGATVSYGRPFKHQCKWARLPDSIVPEEHKDIHAVLIATRDKVFAHTDPAGLKWKGSEMNEVQYEVNAGKASMRLPHHSINEEAIGHFLALTAILVEKASYWVQKHQDKLFRNLSYADGIYSLRLDESEDVLISKSCDPEDWASR